MNMLYVRDLLCRAFQEDIGSGDITATSIFTPELEGTIIFTVKESGVFGGGFVVEEGYRLLDERCKCLVKVKDGERVGRGTVVAEVTGPIVSLLSGERVILNVLQRVSGIATATREVVDLVSDTECTIVDTRKTTPLLRVLEKYAVTVGGGKNHRFGLYDAVMIKDNHIAFAGSVREAVEKVRSVVGHTVKLEVEVETKEQLVEAVSAGVDIIMIDNATPSVLQEWLPLVPSSIVTEASGQITKENVRAYAETGVNVISLGSITHSAKALDISVTLQRRGE